MYLDIFYNGHFFFVVIAFRLLVNTFSGTKTGKFLKRGVPDLRFLKTPASRSRLDERKRRFSCTMISYIMCS